jgi:hypothetical protein
MAHRCNTNNTAPALQFAFVSFYAFNPINYLALNYSRNEINPFKRSDNRKARNEIRAQALLSCDFLLKTRQEY